MMEQGFFCRPLSDYIVQLELTLRPSRFGFDYDPAVDEKTAKPGDLTGNPIPPGEEHYFR